MSIFIERLLELVSRKVGRRSNRGPSRQASIDREMKRLAEELYEISAKMNLAERCPVCNGSGRLLASNVSSTTTAPPVCSCHGCDGKGWVIVKDIAELQKQMRANPAKRLINGNENARTK